MNIHHTISATQSFHPTTDEAVTWALDNLEAWEIRAFLTEHRAGLDLQSWRDMAANVRELAGPVATA